MKKSVVSVDMCVPGAMEMMMCVDDDDDDDDGLLMS